MLGGIGAALAIILFVTAHEAGHFLAAKAVGMKATQFFFGFGPKLWSTQRGETEYGVKLLPFGGYVRIVGMNPLEEVAPEDMGRTYREKKFWEKSIVVLAGVGMNFLIGFLLFYFVVLSAGVPGDPVPVVGLVVDDSPAAAAGLEENDQIVGIDGTTVETWEDATAGLAAAGPGEASLSIRRDGDVIQLDVVLEESSTVDGAGYLGVAPRIERLSVGLIQGVGLAGGMVGTAITDTFYALFQMVRPSSLAEYVGVLVGDTDVPDEVRPVSPIGIVAIGAQAQNLTFLVGILAFVNVILATINLLPLFPLDGGHFAVALYEKLTGREADIRRLIPVAAAVIGLFVFLGFVAIVLDVANPINL